MDLVYLFHSKAEPGLLYATEWITFSGLPLFPQSSWLIRPRADSDSKPERIRKVELPAGAIAWMYLQIVAAILLIAGPLVLAIRSIPPGANTVWSLAPVIGAVVWAAAFKLLLHFRKDALYREAAVVPWQSRTPERGAVEGMPQAGSLIPIREVPRTLAEFYPDSRLRSQVHYAFAHTFLPQYLFQNPWAFLNAIAGPDGVDPDRFIHSRWGLFEQSAGLVRAPDNPFVDGLEFRRITDLGMTLERLPDDRPVALVRMPLPEMPAQACFVAVVPLSTAPPSRWTADLRARVFTLEAMAGQPGGLAVVCEWIPDGAHVNLGQVIPASPEPFLAALHEILSHGDAATSS